MLSNLNPKSFLASKLNWLGIVTVAISTFTYLQEQPLIAENPGIVSAIGVVIGLLTIVLRYFTIQPVNPPPPISFLMKK